MAKDYRIEVKIYDPESEEVIAKENQPMYSGEADNVAAIYRALDSFYKAEEQYESEQ